MIADMLDQAQLDELEQAFRLEVKVAETGPLDLTAEVESLMGFVTSEYLWYQAWLFGIVLDDDAAKVSNLGSYWQPNGVREQGYYVPDDFDTSVPLVTLDNPPKLLSIAEQEAA